MKKPPLRIEIGIVSDSLIISLQGSRGKRRAELLE
jgi:hypothetical protein